ncbi:MAG: universal stress protein [Polyangiaceae bacterium]|nr:universal stress protein [Polyangiaceae bacterium]MCW5789381.1 universal stress protein [Polyangiaceae bacterium]
MQLKKILCPVDFSACSVHALKEALTLAERFQAELTVLHCSEGARYVRPDLAGWASTGDNRPIHEVVRDEALAELGALRLRLDDPPGVIWRVEEGRAIETILEEANAGLYDLVVLGTHGRTGLSHILLGSVAERVVRHATCPVLTLRAALEAEQPA